jgi:hypothetical protein
MGQILRITVNLAFMHRHQQVTRDHRDRRSSAQLARVLIRNSKSLTNQSLFIESLQPAEFGQSISVPFKKHLNGDHARASQKFDHGGQQDVQNKVNETASLSKSS